MDLLVVGSVALDTISSPAGEREEQLGGSAIYFSAAASYFSPVRLVGVVGDDFPWDRVDFLRARGVDLDGLETAPGRTFRWRGAYPEMGDARTLSTELNVFQAFRPEIPQAYRSSPVAFLANIDPDLQLAVLDQLEEAELVACDTMNFWIDSRPGRVFDVLGRVQMAFFNDAEVRSLAGEGNLPKAIRRVHAAGPQVVVVKKGEHGALMSHEGSLFAVPAFPLTEVRDPTGAGDSFAGGMMGYLRSRNVFSSQTFKEALIYGTVMASFAVEEFGAEALMDLKDRQIQERAATLVGMISLVPQGNYAKRSP